MTDEEQWLLKEKYHGEKTEGFFADCDRLRVGEPLAYIIGSIPFLNSTIFLDSHPLIPRTETEFWVAHVITDIKSQGKSHFKVLDLCAGSGCIGVAILKALPMAHVDFAEIDMSHHPTIQKNINYNIPGRQAHIFGGTLFAQVQEKYDYILTNPPYIDPVLNRAETSVTQYEPAQALYGGTDGLEYIRNIIAQASSFLNKGGTLIIEHEPEHVTEISSHAEEYGFAIQTLKDQYNVARFTSLTRKAKALVSQ